MSVDKNHRDQFERYLKGQMTPEEAHAFERDVLDDPFAQEALDGFDTMGVDAIDDLKKLKDKVSNQKDKAFPFMRVAAVVSLLIIGSYSVYYFTKQIDSEQLAIEEESKEEMVQSSPAPDTVLIGNQVKEQEAKSEQLAEEVQESESDEEFFKADEAEVEAIQLADANVVEEMKEETDLERMDTDEIAEAEIEEAFEVAELDIEDDAVDVASGDRSAAVKVVQSTELVPKFFMDTSDLEEIVITPQPLVAQEEQAKNEAKDVAAPRAKKSQPAAVSRSAVINETISGRITDDTGEPLPGVNVVIKGTTTGVTTDIDGNFELPKIGNQTLVVSYVGFESQEIQPGNRSYIDVTLGGATELQEVVITGYGTGATDSSPSYSSAKPEGGNKAYKRYLEENLKYPEAAETSEIEGTVVLELIINSQGQISNITIKKSLGYGCDQEAIRLVREGPKWEAAEKDGITVEDKLRVRIKFKLDR